ncbi:hypothetical protein K490DRAFT_65559 [Saccharata proteae CBS 121410]|uniref:Uncharacterized protein n=1 Tax=Saccharata proteae CBS 121410 TaxID=1314787 RepID=A0A9P4M0A6_9PEZI|nr:hypothetical protein K490DRAFT_65559 [Saccharata proteae CBS 121410]
MEYFANPQMSVLGVKSIEVHVQKNDPSRAERLGSTATVEGPGFSKLLSLKPLSPSHYVNFVGPKEELPSIEDKYSPQPLPPKEVIIDLGDVAVSVKTESEPSEGYRPLTPLPQNDHSGQRSGLLREGSYLHTSGHDARSESHRTEISAAERPHLRRVPREFSVDAVSIDAVLSEHRKVLDEVIGKLQSSGHKLERVRSLSRENLTAASYEETVAETLEVQQSTRHSPLPSSFHGNARSGDAPRGVGIRAPTKDSPALRRMRSDVAGESGLQVPAHNRGISQPRSLPEMFDELQAIQAASDEILSSRDEGRRVIAEAIMATAPNEMVTSGFERPESMNSSGSHSTFDFSVPPSQPKMPDRATQRLTPSPHKDLEAGEDHSKLEVTESQYVRLLEIPESRNSSGSRSTFDISVVPSPPKTPERAAQMHTPSQNEVLKDEEDHFKLEDTESQYARLLETPVDEKNQESADLTISPTEDQGSAESPAMSWVGADFPVYVRPTSPTYTSGEVSEESEDSPENGRQSRNLKFETPLSTSQSPKVLKSTPELEASLLHEPSSSPLATPPSSVIPAANLETSAPQADSSSYSDFQPPPPASLPSSILAADDGIQRLDQDPTPTPQPSSNPPTPPQGITRKLTVHQRILSLEEDSEGWEGGGGPTEQINRLKLPFW